MKNTHQPQDEVICPYCHRKAVLRPASDLFGNHATGKDLLYVCAGYPRCDAYVGVHAKTLKPLGTLANRSLRIKRVQAHKAFDTLWQQGPFTRRGAYQLLRLRFGLTEEDAHIGKFSEEMCEETILFAAKTAGRLLPKTA